MGDEVKQAANALLELMELCTKEGELYEALRRAESSKELNTIDKKIDQLRPSIAEQFNIIRVHTLKLEKERDELKKKSTETHQPNQPA